MTTEINPILATADEIVIPREHLEQRLVEARARLGSVNRRLRNLDETAEEELVETLVLEAERLAGRIAVLKELTGGRLA